MKYLYCLNMFENIFELFVYLILYALRGKVLKIHSTIAVANIFKKCMQYFTVSEMLNRS